MHWQEALSMYARRHEEHCTSFARSVLEQTDQPELVERSGPTKREFVDYLETGLVERDFRELF